MKLTVDGEEYEVPDEELRDYIEALDATESEETSNKYVFGVNVTHTRELGKMGVDIRKFMDTIGEGEFEVQVSVNAKLNETKDKVVGFLADAVGDVEIEEEEYDDWEEDDE